MSIVGGESALRVSKVWPVPMTKIACLDYATRVAASPKNALRNVVESVHHVKMASLAKRIVIVKVAIVTKTMLFAYLKLALTAF